MILNNNQLLKVNGGATISGTLINAIAKIINTLLDVGRAIGSAINMTKNKTKC